MRRLGIVLLGLALSALGGCDPLNALHFPQTSVATADVAAPALPR
jgi:hypothetical protein